MDRLYVVLFSTRYRVSGSTRERLIGCQVAPVRVRFDTRVLLLSKAVCMTPCALQPRRPDAGNCKGGTDAEDQRDLSRLRV